MQRISPNTLSDFSNQSWFNAGLVALLLANLLAIVLISLKMPGITDNQFINQLFRQVLVYHVNLSMLYWMPLVACALWVFAFNIAKGTQWLALTFCGIGSCLLLLSALSNADNVILSNYVPARQSALFLTALSCQFIAVSIIAYASLWHNSRSDDFFKRCLRLAAWCWLIAVASIPYSAVVLQLEIQQQFEQLFWAYGHIQQAANALIIAALWSWFTRTKLTKVTALMLAILPLSVALCLATMLLESLDYRLIFTLQMSIISWLPLLIVVSKIKQLSALNPLLIFSMLLSLLGIITGLLITPGSLTIPAHYHGMTGAFNLAVIAVFLTSYQQGASKWLAYCYGSGLVLLIIGLTWAGNLGVARKLTGEAQQLTTVMHQLAMSTIAIGAFVAISSSVILIVIHLSKLRNPLSFENQLLTKST